MQPAVKIGVITAIAIFVKTPGLSPVKTRLAATLGKMVVEAFHLQAAHTVAAVLSQLAPAARVYFAVAEAEALLAQRQLLDYLAALALS